MSISEAYLPMLGLTLCVDYYGALTSEDEDNEALWITLNKSTLSKRLSLYKGLIQELQGQG